MTRTTLYLFALFVFALDQLTKRWVVMRLPLNEIGKVLIPNFLMLTRTSNTGSAFGLFPGSTLILAAAALIAVSAIIVYVARQKQGLSVLLGIALALPLGGALGNFIDRIRLGYVVDFIDARVGSYQWPVFNVADSAICIGVALLAIYYLRMDAHTDDEADRPEPSHVENK